MKKRIAVVFGTFAPLHQGHIDLIQRAKRQCDAVWVVVSGYKGDRGEQVGLTLQKRFRYIREAFRDDELTSVCKLDETNIPRYPMGWQEWLDQMLQAISYDQTGEELIFFVGESEYQQELSERGFETVLQERKFGISASMIRENPSKYWKYIAQPFRRQFTKKVLIMGSASNGKTTLAKDLARFYDAPVSLEYAREYQIKNNVRDDELTPKDYYYLLLGQYDQTSKLIDSNANRGLVIADTNSLVTKGYYDYYMESEEQEDLSVETFDNLFVSIVAKEKWDLILFVQPIGLYAWLSNRINEQGRPEESHFEAKKLGLIDWLKYLALTAIIWIGMGLAYQSISSARPFRDSVTDATNGVGQLLMTRLYREQWIFWIATNLFSIYLWWGENIHIQGMYWVYTINSLVGWYQWTKAVKEG